MKKKRVKDQVSVTVRQGAYELLQDICRQTGIKQVEALSRATLEYHCKLQREGAVK